MKELFPILAAILTVSLVLIIIKRKENKGPLVSTLNQKKILYWLMGFGIIAMIIVFIVVSSQLL